MRRSGAIVLLMLGCSADYHSGRGKAALDSHQLPAAERHYRKALSRDARHTAALAGLGWTYLLAGQIDAARGAFERCHDVAPSDTDCLRGRASVASSEGKSAEARQLLEAASAIDPHDAGVLSSLALLDLSQGAADAAEARYEQLIARFPERAEYRLGLAEVRIRQDRDAEAVQVTEAALLLDDVGPRATAMLLQTQARALVAATADRVDPSRCDETAPQVRSWLSAARAAVDGAKATGVALPDLPVVERLLRRRRAAVASQCPEPITE